MKKHLSHLFFIGTLFCQMISQYEINIEELITKGTTYYNQGDYSNAIIIYEDLLAEQELTYDNDDIHIAETLIQLGEMYSFIDMPDISAYYFQQAIAIIEKSFQTRKEALELPLIQLLKIYTLNKDTVMKQNTENRLYSISSLFQTLENNNDTTLTKNILLSPEEEDAIDLMELGLSYSNNGLFSEAAIQFSQALNYQTENLDIQFFNSFFPSDSIFRKNMINTFSFQTIAWL